MEKKKWKSVDEAKKELGSEEKVLGYLNHGYNDIQYRNGRRAKEQAMLKAMKKDPKYMKIWSGEKG